ncbi:isoaspartyl peptidase/L-asparaginase [Labedaea rhizosphaerae]|uniref:Beta-aspartyl-peptidase (Threonine type) n=1 Tax=Labedaea rhizosphaerae TaxID=598644 RepID=A0A4R6SG87_LABRH|nr:isoaspartyl peptidase/L-asparaginase [Labedaea rhizosphaerae]TDQ00530.1 beta-aspartyl-peptidase (threonine type) [Labedaea rhizosphaerae]
MNGFVVASRNGELGIGAAIEVLRRGGSALDAVEAGTRLVEASEADTSVGRGGLPNVLGEVELDASIMDGSTRAAGAVGAVRDYQHAITLARRVMEDLPHVTLAGPGAERFAAALGMDRTTLLTPASRELWRTHMVERLGGDAEAVRSLLALPDRADDEPAAVAGHVRRMLDPNRNTGTVNFIARDQDGHIASAVSTSGWEWKHPGRLGDTPLIGAGNYADDRYGAATCTGHGEVTTRCGTARSVVLYLKLGMSLVDSLTEAALDTETLDDPQSGGIEILAVDRDGGYAAVITGADRAEQDATFVHQSTDMAEFAVLPRRLISAEAPPKPR